MLPPFNALLLGSRLSVRTVTSRSLRPKKFTSILENVPTKPRSSWQVYMRGQLGQFKNENGKVDIRKATAELSEKWRNMPDADKKKYVTRYETESKAHETAVKEALESATPQQFRAENTLRRKHKLPVLKDPKAPKRPLNIYLLYLAHLRQDGSADFKKLSVADQAREGARMYKNLSLQEKAPYEKKAKLQFEKYSTELAAYEKKYGTHDQQDIPRK